MSNSQAWLEAYPAGSRWDLAFNMLPSWAELGPELQAQLEAPSQVYGAVARGKSCDSSGQRGRM